MDPLVQAAIAELTYAHGELRTLLQELPGEALTWHPGPQIVLARIRAALARIW